MLANEELEKHMPEMMSRMMPHCLEELLPHMEKSTKETFITKVNEIIDKEKLN